MIFSCHCLVMWECIQCKLSHGDVSILAYGFISFPGINYIILHITVCHIKQKEKLRWEIYTYTYAICFYKILKEKYYGISFSNQSSNNNNNNNNFSTVLDQSTVSQSTNIGYAPTYPLSYIACSVSLVRHADQWDVHLTIHSKYFATFYFFGSFFMSVFNYQNKIPRFYTILQVLMNHQQ